MGSLEKNLLKNVKIFINKFEVVTRNFYYSLSWSMKRNNFFGVGGLSMVACCDSNSSTNTAQ